MRQVTKLTREHTAMADLFTTLMAELGQLMGCGPVAQGADPPQAAALRLDGVDFTIVHGRAPADLLSTYCKFGKLPTDGDRDELVRLMQANLALAASCAGTLGLNSETGDVVYVSYAPLRGLTAADLLNSLRHLAEQAREWQQQRDTRDLASPDLSPTSSDFA
jgi:hypothetical protein